MHQVTTRVAALALVASALAACDSQPLAPLADSPARAGYLTAGGSGNTVYLQDATVPFPFVVYASCANGGQGEVLQVAGQLTYRGHSVSTTQGQQVHYQTVESFTGAATGWDTGEAYDVSTRGLAQGNTFWGTDGILDSGEELQRVRMLLTSRSTGATIEVVLTGRFVQTATGDWVLDGWEGSARCGQ